MNIIVHVETIDHLSKTRKFKTLKGARRFAEKYVGETPDISFTFRYAVSFDGVAKVDVYGDASIYDVFPKSDRPS